MLRRSRCTGAVGQSGRQKLAEENNIDLATLKGTGKGGRILKEDVQNALAVPKVPGHCPCRRQGFSARGYKRAC